MKQGPKVLFIGGSGRNGSTLLERLLGELPGWFAVGEVRFLFEAASRGYLCGCGDRVSECTLWAPVLDEVIPSGTATDYAVMHEQLRLATRHRHLWRLARLRPHRDRSANPKAVVRKLYLALLRHAEGQVLVDSSKSLSWALLVRGSVPELDLRTVHLVRDSRGVAYSNVVRKMRRDAVDTPTEVFWRPAWRASLHWAYVTLAWRMTRIKGKRARVLRYEDFVRAPVKAVRELVQDTASCVDEAVLGRLGGRTVTLRPSHGIKGNPDRFDVGPVRVEVDERWMDSLSFWQRLAVTGITAPLLKSHGYKLRPTRSPSKVEEGQPPR